MDNSIEVDGDKDSIALKILLSELAGSNDAEVRDTHTPVVGDEPEQLEGIESSGTKDKPNLNKSGSEQRRETLLFFEQTDITETTPFSPGDETDSGKQYPIKSSGQIDSIFIQAQDNTFKVTLEIDGDKIIDNQSWSDLDSISQELAHIGAYQRDSDQYILAISDYPFNEELDLSIRPTSETAFDYVRNEIMIDEYSTGDIL